MSYESPLVTKLSDTFAEIVNICAEQRVDHREMARILMMFATALGRLPTLDADIAIDVDDSSGRIMVNVTAEP